MAKKKLFSLPQLTFFLVGLIVIVTIWASVLRGWVNEGFVSLQPETLIDWFKTLGILLVLPFTVVAFIVSSIIVVAIGLQNRKN